MYKNFFKRVIDFCIALVALTILFIPLSIVTLWLYFANKGAGAFFFQDRCGKNSKIFKIVKFKTMNDEKDKNGYLLPDKDRITRVGRLIRGTSIDELPQLWNVLIGDMALIGPRPLLPRYLPYYTDSEKHRHDVRPGITGWAQVNGRNYVNWDNKLAMDIYYVNHISLLLDLNIFFKTVANVLIRKDVSAVNCEVALDKYRQKQI